MPVNRYIHVLISLVALLVPAWIERIEHTFDLAVQGYTDRIFTPTLSYPQSRRFVQGKMQVDYKIIFSPVNTDPAKAASYYRKEKLKFLWYYFRYDLR